MMAATGTDHDSSCEVARVAIMARQFAMWRGLPANCSPEVLFGVPWDPSWGVVMLGSHFERARTRLLDLEGYYRPLAFARDGVVVLFDGMNPELPNGWSPLEADLGAPELVLDWMHRTIAMPGGERVHAGRGITVFLNPENQFVAHVVLYVPTTTADYLARLRPNYEQRLHRTGALP